MVREWISQLLIQHEVVLRIALRQRAEFEGWLKFELAALAEKHGAEAVEVESSYTSSASQMRSDMAFYFKGIRYNIQLKTVNSNWRMPGVDNKTQPITKNVAGIVNDALKLRAYSGQGVMAFVLFPIPPQDNRWIEYLKRIAAQLGIDLNENHNCKRLSMKLGNDDQADLIICTFQFPYVKSTQERYPLEPLADHKPSNMVWVEEQTITVGPHAATIWEEITQLEGTTLKTLARHKPFDIVKVKELKVIIKPDGGKERAIPRKAIEGAFNALATRGQLTRTEIRTYANFNTAYVAAILTGLSSVASSIKPICLYYKAK